MSEAKTRLLKQHTGLLCFEKTLADVFGALRAGSGVVIAGERASDKTSLMDAIADKPEEWNKAGFDEASFVPARDLLRGVLSLGFDSTSAPSRKSAPTSLVGRIAQTLRSSFKRAAGKKLLCIDGFDEYSGNESELREAVRGLVDSGIAIHYVVSSRDAGAAIQLQRLLGSQDIAVAAMPMLLPDIVTLRVQSAARRCEVSFTKAETNELVGVDRVAAIPFSSRLILALRRKIQTEAAKRSRRPGQFYTSIGIRNMLLAGNSVAHTDVVLDMKLVFSTAKQRTWIASTLHHVYCILDDEKNRKRDAMVQWQQPLTSTPRVGVHARHSLFDINEHKNWLYSPDLHPDSEALKRILTQLSSPNDLA